MRGKVIDKIQNYYGKAIRGHKGDLNGMKESIKTIQCHMIKRETEEPAIKFVMLLFEVVGKKKRK